MKNKIAFVLLVLSALSVSAAEKPNVVVILADDLGWMDIVSYASRVHQVKPEECFYETPHIDRMAQQGMMFTQAYSAALCSPGRAALLTGQYPARFGFLTASGHTSGSYFTRKATPPKGYHIHDRKETGPIQANPALGYIDPAFTYVLQSGQPQDEYDALTIAEALKGYRSAMVGKWHLGAKGIEGYQPKDQGFEELAYVDDGGSHYFNWRDDWDLPGEALGIEYLSDDLTERAVRFIRECDQNKEPFFLYFPELAVHGPREAKQADYDYFEKKPNRGANGHSVPEYAGVLRGLDNSVGRLLQELDALGIAENTLVIFMSDNGGINRETVTSNLPLREGKGKLYEGGVRVPFIAYWPGRIEGGTVCDVPIGVEDVFPTVLSVAGQADGLSNLEIDGQSILSLLKEPKNKAKHYTRDTFFWHKAGGGIDKKGKYWIGHTAVRKGNYKLLYDAQGILELYNIEDDIEEKNDLSEAMPEKTQELFKVLDGMLDEVVPKKYQRRPNPFYDPEANAKTQAPPYHNLRKQPLEKTNAKPAPIKAEAAKSKAKGSAVLMPPNQSFESRIWAKGKTQEMEGSLVDLFVNPKGKTILEIKTPDGQTNMLGAKVLQADDLAYLKSVGAKLPEG